MNVRIEWSVQTIIALVMSLGAFISFCVSFDRRISENRSELIGVKQMMNDREAVSREYRADSTERMKDIDAKLDRLIERREK